VVSFVPAFRLFFFRASKLDRSETLQAPDAMTAIEQAARRPSNDVVELWSDQGKVATFRPASRNVFE
jgi:hypothetical protein